MSQVPDAERNVNHPPPELVVEKLLARRPSNWPPGREGGPQVAFKPAAGQFNVLAAAWIQFMVHDWMEHVQDTQAEPHVLPASAAGDAQPVAEVGNKPACPFALPKTAVFQAASGLAGHRNFNSAWWDAGQLYDAPK